MNATKILLAALLSCFVLLAGCSRPASDSPPVEVPPTEDAPAANMTQENNVPPSAQNEEKPEETASDDDDKDKEDTTSAEKAEEDKPKNDDPAANATQGCYKLFDSGFEVTVKDPFVVYYDPLASNMTITIQDDPTCRGYLFYDTSSQSMTQLEEAVKSLEPSVEDDPTITDLKTDVQKQDNGLFSFTFSYSAGAAEGSPAGFYFIHYQKTENGVLNANLFTERSSNSAAILELIDSIQPLTENAVEYGK